MNVPDERYEQVYKFAKKIVKAHAAEMMESEWVETPDAIAIYVTCLAMVMDAAVQATPGKEAKRKRIYDLKRSVKEMIESFNPPIKDEAALN